MKYEQNIHNAITRHIGVLPVFLVAVMVLIMAVSVPVGWAKGGKHVEELDEAEVFIEWNSTDTDYGIQFFWDCSGFKNMKVRNTHGKLVLDIKTSRNVRAQGLTEGFFESVEPPSSELSMEEFMDRFPEGDYTFRGKGIEGEWLVGETELTHTLPAPPGNLYPAEDDEVSHEGFEAGFDPVTEDTEGNPIDIEFYVVVVEKEDDDPIRQVYEVILRPVQTWVWVPEEFLEPGTEYKLEVIAQEETGNRTITETGTFMTED